MVAQGKEVFTGERRSLNMPDLSGKLNDKGEPLQRHLISCHLCTQVRLGLGLGLGVGVGVGVGVGLGSG